MTGESINLVYSSEYGHLYQGDCLELMAQMGDGSVDLVFADPPFNLNKDYGKGINDSLDDADYLDWCRGWISDGIRVLADGGSFFLYNLPKWNIELGHYLGDQGMMFRHWIAIDLKMMLPVPGRLYPSHYSLLYYTKGKPKAFTRPRYPVPVCRHCGGDIKDYGGHRNKLNPEGLNVADVWTDIPPVRHRGTKRRGANELSEKLLKRVVTIGSDEGDLIFDPFGGSGTTYAVAERMHRHWLGIELGDAEPIIARLEGRDFYVEAPNNGDAGKGMTSQRRVKVNSKIDHPSLF
ncbi:MAG: site-specific DNA-methyltransferase [Deferrisomatales bacterium]|nr:site-specific DNA-methyltransferase [Deferrisomatales bacterium]